VLNALDYAVSCPHDKPTLTQLAEDADKLTTHCFVQLSTPSIMFYTVSYLSELITHTVLSRVNIWQHVARQHVAFNMLLVAVNKIVASLLLYTKGYICCRDTGNMLPATSKQHVAIVAGNMLLVRAICCRATCCPGVNAALDPDL